jgi:hypothetical protein
MIEILLTLVGLVLLLGGMTYALWKRNGLLKTELSNAVNRADVNNKRVDRVVEQQQQLNEIDEQQQRDLQHVKDNLHKRNDFNATGL